MNLECSDKIGKSVSLVGIAFTKDKFVVIIVHKLLLRLLKSSPVNVVRKS